MTEPTAGGDPPSVATRARERTVEDLCAHFGQDHMSLAELERRLDVAYAARSQAQLEALLSDLPALPEIHVAEASVPAGPPALVKERDLVVNVLGGSERRGRWTPPRRLLVVTVMGGVVLDFREAAFATDEVDVTVVALMGQMEILVPPSLRVEVAGVPIMGAFEHRAEEASPEAPSPVLRVKGTALMGGVDVKVLRPEEMHRPDW